MYEEPIFLMAVDDRVKENMDASYDIRIHVRPYKVPNPSDRALLKVCEEIIQCMSNVRSVELLSKNNNEKAFEDEVWLM
jgi:hypothetical protein